MSICRLLKESLISPFIILNFGQHPKKEWIEYKIRKILEILDNPTRYEMLKILSKKKFTEKIIEDEYKKYFKKKLV